LDACQSVPLLLQVGECTHPRAPRRSLGLSLQEGTQTPALFNVLRLGVSLLCTTAARLIKMDKQQNQIIAGTDRGATTINVQQLLTKPWYQYRHLRRLYGWLVVVLMVQATNGFDGSLMNGKPYAPTATHSIPLSVRPLIMPSSL